MCNGFGLQDEHMLDNTRLRDNLKSLQADLDMLLCAELVSVGEHTRPVLCNYKSLQCSQAHVSFMQAHLGAVAVSRAMASSQAVHKGSNGNQAQYRSWGVWSKLCRYQVKLCRRHKGSYLSPFQEAKGVSLDVEGLSEEVAYTQRQPSMRLSACYWGATGPSDSSWRMPGLHVNLKPTLEMACS